MTNGCLDGEIEVVREPGRKYKAAALPILKWSPGIELNQKISLFTFIVVK